MSEQVERAKAPAVVSVVELMGVSDKSWSDAAQQAVVRASKTVRHITGLDVLRSSAVVRDGKITEYHVHVKVAFVVEPKDLGATHGAGAAHQGTHESTLLGDLS